MFIRVKRLAGRGAARLITLHLDPFQPITAVTHPRQIVTGGFWRSQVRRQDKKRSGSLTSKTESGGWRILNGYYSLRWSPPVYRHF